MSVLHSVNCLLTETPFFQDDDEWDDYRENKKDYTGLKIETLVIEDVEKPAVEEETEVTPQPINYFLTDSISLPGQ